MTIEDLAKLVTEMRAAQDTHRNTLTDSTWNAARKLEEKVDRCCRRILDESIPAG